MQRRFPLRMSVGAIALSLGACAGAPQPKHVMPAPASASVDELAAAVAADSRRSDGSHDAQLREQLAADAASQAQACLQLAPQAAACLYYHAVALGMQARAHPLRANELLKTMLEALSAADAADPAYDRAGPARVKALVLVRAPGWPLGPGDLDAALVAAHRAVELQPQYPANLLALAETLAKTGDAAGARDDYQRARDLAQAAPASSDRDDWVKQADQGLRR